MARYSMAEAKRQLRRFLHANDDADTEDLVAALHIMRILAGTVRSRERFNRWLQRDKTARVAFTAYLIGTRRTTKRR